MCEREREGERNRGKDEMESCESKESDVVRFGQDQKNLKTSIISLYTCHRPARCAKNLIWLF